MKIEHTKANEALRRIWQKGLVGAIALMLVFLLLIAVTCNALYASVRQNIQLEGELNVARSAALFDNYLAVGRWNLQMTALAVEEMLEPAQTGPEDAVFLYHTEENLVYYLESEANHMRAVYDPDFRGYYGWLRGRYVQTGEWVPDEDYIPTDRPWFTEAIGQEGVVMVRPYVDAEIGTYTMSLATRLGDGESVLALDLELDKLQLLCERMAEENPGVICAVVDDAGGLVVHSNRAALERARRGDDGALDEAILQTLRAEGGGSFDVVLGNEHYTAFARELVGGWYALSAVDTAAAFRSLNLVMVFSAVFLMGTLAGLVILYLRLRSRNNLAETLNRQLGAVAERYLALQDIDLTRDTYRVINTGAEGRTLSEEQPQAQASLYDGLEVYTDPASKAVMWDFVDLKTLDERLKNEQSVSEEFLSFENTWCRARFMAEERDAGGKLTRVIWIVENIDSEKRRENRLLFLSETDWLTGLKNRGSGESHITSLMGTGQSGMFLLLDVDKFKSFNDTFGHQVGDKVLVTIADALQRTFRGSDVVMRLGGDEFAVYALGVTDEERGRMIVDRFFARLEKTVLDELCGQPICVSAGAAFYHKEDNFPFRALYERADRGTYEAKKHQGNCLIFAPEGSDSEETA